MPQKTFARWFAGMRRQALTWAAVAFVTSASGVQAADSTAARSEKSSAMPAPPPLHTATAHPMKYFLSLPPQWSRERKWPVLVAPSAHYGDKGRTLAMFAAARDARHASFIIVSPLVINADPVAPMTEYRGAVADAITAADAATGFRDAGARAKFDSEGIRAVLADVRELYRGEDRMYLTGFSASTHVAYLFLFTHPELLEGVVINSGVYLGRGVDEENIPGRNSPERAKLPIKFIVGEKDPGYRNNMENWERTRAKLLQYGHSAAMIQSEVIRAGNAEHLNAGHNWFPTRILDFFGAVESSSHPE